MPELRELPKTLFPPADIPCNLQGGFVPDFIRLSRGDLFCFQVYLEAA